MMLLVEPLIPGLRRYAHALLQDTAAADDLVQDCLERAISRWHQRRADGNARTWMFTILHNLAMNRLKQSKRRGAHVPLESADDVILGRPATQENGLHEGDIMSATARLPEDQRAVVLLISVEDLSYAETAKALGVPIGTVMSRLSRARERLRIDLADERRPASASHLRSVN
ncbi:sigma-70 family RNA polymerase sigma factor [Sphingomonas sp. So64.6b]|nr:sigma-70 family RNA polymerase sigma factor [Sphingomonas sp. So64.6b]